MNAHDPKSVVELLQAMVRIDSINPQMGGKPRSEQAIGDYLFNLATQWKLKVQRLVCEGRADQILITVSASEKDRPWILFDSHIDTVSVEGMTVDPFGGVIEAGHLYGRGACDTKGTGAAMLWALREYADQLDRPNHIALLFGVDEEHTMVGVQSFINHDLPRLDWRPSAVIVGEPTEHHPIIAHHGLLRWTITTRGVAAHSSVPHEGRSAISAMVKVIAALESQYIPALNATDDLTGSAACSINVIRGGSAANVIPDTCEIEVDRRVVPGGPGVPGVPGVPGENEAETLAAMDRVLASLDVEVERTTTVRHPPMTTKHNSALVQQTQRVLSDMSLPTMVIGAAFATHAAYYDDAGLSAIVIGPGEIHKAHTKDESISIDQLEQGVELYGRLMRM